jgi:hypothetical protein
MEGRQRGSAQLLVPCCEPFHEGRSDEQRLLHPPPPDCRYTVSLSWKNIVQLYRKKTKKHVYQQQHNYIIVYSGLRLSLIKNIEFFRCWIIEFSRQPEFNTGIHDKRGGLLIKKANIEFMQAWYWALILGRALLNFADVYWIIEFFCLFLI